MKKKPIYVEIQMDAPMDEIWEYTQNPRLHEQWDLRFSSITYLPKEEDDASQTFTYETKVFPSLKIQGWGVSKGTHSKENGTKTSSLHFGTEQKISPIVEGKGYWKYIPNGNRVTFLTQYDYEARFGTVGRIADYFFRPLIGWATALSFDVLKRWLEKGESPASQYKRFFSTTLINCLFFFIWFYHGLLPKIVFQQREELEFFFQLGMNSHTAQLLVNVVGIGEILFALLWLLPIRKRGLYQLQILIFPLLTALSLIGNFQLAGAAFNPITFNSALFILSIVGFLFSDDLPTATSCIRKKGKKK